MAKRAIDRISNDIDWFLDNWEYLGKLVTQLLRTELSERTEQHAENFKIADENMDKAAKSFIPEIRKRYPDDCPQATAKRAASSGRT